MREINLGALRQQFNQAYAQTRSINSTHMQRISELDLKEFSAEGKRKIQIMSEQRKRDNAETGLTIEQMASGQSRNYALAALRSREELGLLQLDDKQINFMQEQQRAYDQQIRSIRRTKDDALDRITTDNSIKSIFAKAQFDAGQRERDIAHRHNNRMAEIKNTSSTRIRKAQQTRDLFQTFVSGLGDQFNPADPEWENTLETMDSLIKDNIEGANSLFDKLLKEHSTADSMDFIFEWMGSLASSHNPPGYFYNPYMGQFQMGPPRLSWQQLAYGQEEGWRKRLRLAGRLDLNEEVRRIQNEQAGLQTVYKQSVQQANQGGYYTAGQWNQLANAQRSPSQQAAIAAVIAQNPDAAQEIQRFSARGTASMLQQGVAEQDKVLAINAELQASGYVDHLKRQIDGMSLNERRAFLKSGKIETAFGEILEGYGNIQTPEYVKQLNRAVKKGIADVKMSAEIGAMQVAEQEQEKIVQDANRELFAAVMRDPESGAVKSAMADWNMRVLTSYGDVAAQSIAEKERDAIVYRARLGRHLSHDPKKRDLKAAQNMLGSPQATDFLTQKELQQASGQIQRAIKEHQKELKAKRIESIQQWADKYGMSKKKVKSSLDQAIKTSNFQQLKQLAQDPQVLPEDRMIINNMLAKARAKVNPADGYVTGFASNEVLGYRGKQYKLGRKNRIVSDPNKSLDMQVENNFRLAFNRMLRKDPVALRKQLLQDTTPLSVADSRRLYGGRALTNEEALEMGSVLTQLAGSAPQARVKFSEALALAYGDDVDVVMEEALLTSLANASGGVEKDKINTARIVHNGHLKGLLPDNLKANHLRTTAEVGLLKPKAAGVKASLEPVRFQEIRDSLPHWAYGQLSTIVQQAALYKALTTPGQDIAKQAVYDAELGILSDIIADTVKLQADQFGEGADVSGLNKALSGIMVNSGSLDIPASIVDKASLDLGAKARNFVRSMTGTEMAKRAKLFDPNTVAAIHRGGPRARYKLAKREDVPGAFNVILTQGDTLFPLKLKDGTFLKVMAEDIFLHGELFNLVKEGEQ